MNKQAKSSFVNGVNNIDVKFKGRSGVVVPNRVFVGGICPTATETDLANLFGKYGAVKAIKIVFDQNGSSKGYGFVTFEKADDVSRLQNDVRITSKKAIRFSCIYRAVFSNRGSYRKSQGRTCMCIYIIFFFLLVYRPKI